MDWSNPIRDILFEIGMEEIERQEKAKGRTRFAGALVKYNAWVPRKHPVSGHVVSDLTPVIDRIISDEDAANLEAQFAMEAATGKADDFYDEGENRGG
jgi:hypothetical protein